MTSRSEQSQTPQDASPTCPVGKKDCAIAAEVASLRRQLSELSTLVRTDPLTGLANYRYFLLALDQEIERTQRSGQPTSLVMLDIDHFKEVNDRWGHETGNLALVHLARLLQQTVRRLDIPCRYGGEEFAIILPDTDLAASIPVAERIRQAIEASALKVSARELRITVSQGIATYTNDLQTDAEDLVRRADHYLYLAKESGRNRVCHPELPDIELVSPEERKALSRLFGSGQRKKDKP